MNQETPALDIPAIDYVIQGDREYCRLQQELNEANERNDGHAIARIHGQLETLDAWTIQSRAASLLHGLGFSQDEIAQPVKSFSGGWRMRLNLAQALLCPSDLLLLDEPTNHLDLDAVIWLERWLVQYQGTLVLISHDRDFLDPIVTKILHIENQKLNEYTGDYSPLKCNGQPNWHNKRPCIVSNNKKFPIYKNISTVLKPKRPKLNKHKAA